MNIKSVSIVLALFFSLTSFSQTPNILLIIADDLGVDALNGYTLGSVNPNTPHLDSIRLSGLTFSNAWSSPVCTPTRAGMMSGMYGSINGVRTAPGNLDTSYISLLEALKISSPTYTTGVTGKWHISKPVNELHPIWTGADHYTGVLEGAVAAYDNWDKTENGITANSTEYVTSYFTDDAISWIDSQSNPWLLWLAHVAPHTPVHVPPAYMYTQPTTVTPLKKYMAMIESLDYEVGRLLDTFTPAEKANTIIIFIGDNGTPSNLLQDYPADHGKESLYQGGIHVPMFVSGYGVTRVGETEDALVNLIDIYATVLDITGSNLPGGIYNSLSFEHLLTSSSLPKRQYNFSEIDSNLTSIHTQGFTIRDATYKLIEYHTGQQEMFNLNVDPLETNDLLLGTLTAQEQSLKIEFELEANQRKTAWSCNDDIQNGDELGIDCGGTYCSPCGLSLNDEPNSMGDVLLFPNPTENLITISSLGESFEKVRLFNVLGELIFEQDVSHEPSVTLDLSHLNRNIYYVQICFPLHSIWKKIIVQ
ncbi:MAG: sulfatase [Fluviicola sp.]|nr:MAG: sulfatase [Fluviicola sp.]